ncbi:hypothetical protein ACFPYN_01920 [Paenisporosarcina macmurdoensis]|uniref:Uncharacterized protein n=1 Tax=Paenisporosarcina macmurdoensis TaxID=212659 RepID=A0ABW1L240_9BACL
MRTREASQRRDATAIFKGLFELPIDETQFVLEAPTEWKSLFL